MNRRQPWGAVKRVTASRPMQQSDINCLLVNTTGHDITITAPTTLTGLRSGDIVWSIGCALAHSRGVETAENDTDDSLVSIVVVVEPDGDQLWYASSRGSVVTLPPVDGADMSSYATIQSLAAVNNRVTEALKVALPAIQVGQDDRTELRQLISEVAMAVEAPTAAAVPTTSKTPRLDAIEAWIKEHAPMLAAVMSAVDAIDLPEAVAAYMKANPAPAGETGPQGPAGATGAQGAKGDVGAVGAQGPQGAPGDDGAVGQPGADGAVGAQGPIGLTGPQGPAGAAGAVGAAGPKGDKGDVGSQGAQGATGAQGPAGPKGDIGLPGATGAPGAKGDTGAKGDKGTDGVAGAPGAAGAQGATGAQGAVGATGPQGSKGDTGAVGATGAAGAKGDQGVKGDTGAAGAAGTQGATGPAGPAGAAGAAGAKGDQGAKGDAGAKGDTGATGPAGPTGPAGAAGAQGATGATGAQGPTGATGPAGPTGPAGADARPVGVGTATVGLTGILGSSKDVVVTLDKTMSGTTYKAVATVSAPVALLGQVACQVKSQTTTTVTVTVKNTALISSGTGTILVIAVT